MIFLNRLLRLPVIMVLFAFIFAYVCWVLLVYGSEHESNEYPLFDKVSNDYIKPILDGMK